MSATDLPPPDAPLDVPPAPVGYAVVDSADAPDGVPAGAWPAPTVPPVEPRTAPRWVPKLGTVLVIAGVILITLWQLHPHLLFTQTLTDGGDTGAHVMMPPYLRTLLAHGQITGWDPGWYDGYSIYTYYFILPDLFAALAGLVIPYTIAFKLVTVLGSVLLPICAWAMGRLMGLRDPIAAALAAFTLPYLFDYTFTIYGGNLFSTLAGEYAYSFSIALALLFLGLFARGLRTGRGRGWSAVTLAACILAHIIPAAFALAGAAFLTLFELLPPSRMLFNDPVGEAPFGIDRATETPRPRKTTLWWASSTVGLGVALSGWWLIPFLLRQNYSNPMGYANVTTYATLLFPEADWWVIIIAGLALIAAFVMRSRLGVLLGLLAGVSGAAVVLDPQGAIYNTRFLPLWFLALYLLAGWGLAVLVIGGSRVWQSLIHLGAPAGTVPEARLTWTSAPVIGPVLAFLTVAVVVVPPFIAPLRSDLPVTVGANLVTNWSAYNYEGYQDQAAWPEYKAVIDMMATAGYRYGCGRAMWEYNIDEDRFGTPEALMLLPYWTNRCIDSMEGLLFESSATTPYHFLNQAELSVGPSEPQVGLDYGTLDVALGVEHLQLLGVKYFLAEKPQTEAQAMADPALKLIAHTGPWPNSGGTPTSTTWDLFLVRDSSLVTPLANEPNVLKGIKPDQADWCCTDTVASNGTVTPILKPSETWYLNPSLWDVELAQSGPSNWPVVAKSGDTQVKVRVPKTTVSHITTTDESISFHVTRLHTPVLVKVSYFPNWKASGAAGPYRVTPNLMAVVPTSHTVTLTYGTTTANNLGEVISFLALVGVVVPGGLWWWRRRRRAAAPAHRATTPTS